MGKTRLLLELGRSAERRQVSVLPGECIPAGAFSGLESAPAARGRSRQSPSFAGTAGPLQALRKPLRALGDHCREKGLAETERIFGRRGKILALYESSLSGLPGQDVHPEPAELPPQAAVLRLHAYLEETFLAYARRGSRGRAPTLVLLDDLQWADELTVGFLEYLMRVRTLAVEAQHFAPLPLVVGTYRSEEVDTGLAEVGATNASPLRRLIETSGIVSIGLGRLDEAAVGRIVGDMLAITPPPVLLSRQVARHSEGNPFFVAEYLRAAVAEELLYRDTQGRWQVVDRGEERATEATYEALPLPRSLRELVGRRLAGLGQSARKLLQAAAVLGRESPVELLQRMAGSVGAHGSAPFLVAVDELLRRQILEESASGLRFVHDKLREVAYENPRKVSRRKLHRAAAEALESVHAGRLEPHHAALGHHWEEAVQPEKARDHYLAAARTVGARHALEEANQLYRAYLRLVEQPTVESIKARNALGVRILQLLGRNEEALAQHEKALSEARGLGSREQEGASLRLLGSAHSRIGRMEEARQLLDQSLAVYRQAGDWRGESMALGEMARVHRMQGRIEESRQLYEQALAAHRQAGDRSSEGMMLGDLGALHFDQGQPEQVEQFYEQALAVHHHTGNRENEGLVLGNLANVRYHQGRLEEARQLYERALGLHREVGDRRREGFVLGNLALFHFEQGRLEEALRCFEQALAVHRQIGNRLGQGVVLSNLAILHREDGRPEEARQLLEQALDLHRQTGNSREEGICLSNLANVHKDRGRLEEARQLYEQALGLHRQLGDRRSEAIRLSGLAAVHGDQGRIGEARQLYEQALDLARQIGNRRLEGLFSGDLAQLERLTAGDLERASELAGQGERFLIAAEDKRELAKLCCGSGHIALARGESGRPWLDRAQALAEGLGAGAESRFAKAGSKLRRAVHAFEAGEHHRLFRGELIEDVPEGLRRWLVETGQLTMPP